MNKKELQEMISNPLSGTNMNELVQKSAEKADGKQQKSIAGNYNGGIKDGFITVNEKQKKHPKLYQ